MNPIDKAIQDVQFNIPKDILQYAFISTQYRDFRYPVTLESQIREKVIEARVLADCNLVGGVQLELDISSLRPIYDDGRNRVYKIPKTMTENRSISSILSAGYDRNESRNRGYDYDSSTMTRAGHRLLSATTKQMSSTTTDVTLIGDNTILIKDWVDSGYIYTLRCVINNDSNMANLKPTAIPAFSKLVLLATKAWVYVNTVIPTDKNALYGGQEIGRLKDVIDEYADSNTLYEEYLTETWTKVAFMDDIGSYHRLLKLTIN